MGSLQIAKRPSIILLLPPLPLGGLPWDQRLSLESVTETSGVWRLGECLKQGPAVTRFAPMGRRRLAVTGGVRSGWHNGYQGNLQGVMPFTAPFINCWEQSLAGAWDKYVGSSVIWVGYRWSRHWLGRATPMGRRRPWFQKKHSGGLGTSQQSQYRSATPSYAACH